MPLITGDALTRFLRKKRITAARRRAEVCRKEAFRNPKQAYAWRQMESYEENLANELESTLTNDYSLVSGTFGEMYVRPKHKDFESIEQVQWTAGVGILPGETVMDIGAHIGCFTRTVALPAAKHVVAVEADPENAKVLRKNAEGYPVTVINAAVTADGDTVTLYHSRTNPKAHSLYIKGAKREAITVPALRLSSLLEDFQPSVLKIDIEGAEHEIGLADEDLPLFVRALALEIHIDETASRKWWRESAEKIVNRIEAQGFRSTEPYDLDEKRWVKSAGGWYTTCRIERCWIRR